MKKGQASRTAEYMALFRALESTRPGEGHLFEDRFAAAFLALPLRLVAGLSRLPVAHACICRYIDHRWPGARTSAVARTRFIDDQAALALGSGIAQVVILGAGFDSRAYRIPGMAQVVVFEVDHPATSRAKRQGVETRLGAVPPHVHFVPIDFNTERLPETIAAAGFDSRRRTLFIWEGVTNYLTEAAVEATLRWCAKAASGSTIVFTYVHRDVLDRPHAFRGTARLFTTLLASGEGWTFGLDPASLSSFVAHCGLALERDVGASDYRACYFGGAACEMRGYEFYRIAVARVPGSPGSA